MPVGCSCLNFVFRGQPRCGRKSVAHQLFFCPLQSCGVVQLGARLTNIVNAGALSHVFSSQIASEEFHVDAVVASVEAHDIVDFSS